MQLNEIVNHLELTVYSGGELLNREVTGAYISDLLSDVMGNSNEGQLWITLQTHKNVVAVASLRDLAGIILVKGLKPDEETINAANQEGVPILGTLQNTFEISGKLFNFISI